MSRLLRCTDSARPADRADLGPEPVTSPVHSGRVVDGLRTWAEVRYVWSYVTVERAQGGANGAIEYSASRRATGPRRDPPMPVRISDAAGPRNVRATHGSGVRCPPTLPRTSPSPVVIK